MLPLLLYKLTGAHRYRPQFEWSSSWVCNVFRLWELIAWRREGIRLEQIADRHGNVFSFTLENYLATWEGIIRAWFSQSFAFKVVLLPQAQLAGFRSAHGFAPYRFAIALDTFIVDSTGNKTTWSHTVTGSNPYLMVGEDQQQNASGITYNSVSMTKQVSVVGAASWEQFGIWALGNPASGAHTVTITTTGVGFYSGSISYSGCQSATTADNTGSAASSASASSPQNLSITPVADNCWMVAWFQGGSVAIAAGAGTTGHTTGGDGFEFWCDNNAAIHPAASTTLQCTWTGTNKVVVAGVTIAPFVASASVSVGMTRTLMGVGS
jgi:hypothetical protein